MKKKIPPDPSGHLYDPGQKSAVAADAPELHAGADPMAAWSETLQRGLVESTAQTGVEERALRFLAHALGPTATGLSHFLDTTEEEALGHLRQLETAGLAWQHTAGGEGPSGWHLTSDGHRYLEERDGLLPPPRI